MALVTTPSTPISQIVNGNISTPSPGTWRHPKFDEIARRQNACTFTDSNVRKVIWNGGALLILWVIASSAQSRYVNFATPIVFKGLTGRKLADSKRDPTPEVPALHHHVFQYP